MFVLICKRDMRNALVFLEGWRHKNQENPVVGRFIEEPQKTRENPMVGRPVELS